MNRRLERKERRRKAAQKAILDAAERALVPGGLTAITMESIAGEAGYTAGALYSYFSNKDAIVTALFDRLADEMLACVERPEPEGLDFLEILRWRMKLLMEVARRRTALFYAHFVQGLGPPDHRERHEIVHDAMLRAIAAMLRRGIDEGAIRETEPLDLALALLGIQREFFIRWLYTGQNEAIEERASRALALFMRGARPEHGEPTEGTQA